MREHDFEVRKARSLAALGVVDNSPKGSLDAPIVDLINLINRHPDYVTCSSCSGRITLWNKGWQVSEHRLVSETEILSGLKGIHSTMDSDKDEYSILRFEPFLLAVEAASIEAAQKLCTAGVEAGFRESGINVQNRIIVTIRSTARLESIICSNECHDNISTLVRVANERFTRNEVKTRQFEDYFRAIDNSNKTECSDHWILVEPKHTFTCKEILHELGFAGGRDRVVMKYGDKLAIPVSSNLEIPEQLKIYSVEAYTGKLSYTKKPSSPYKRLVDEFASTPTIKIPQKWELVGDIALFPSDSFPGASSETWERVAKSLGVSRVGRQHPIQVGDPLRESRAEILYPLDAEGWTLHKENGVVYEFDVTKCMFASGNGTERKRLGEIVRDGESVLDMFAGIGYFTLQILVHCKPEIVYACEWNPNSITALSRGKVRNCPDSKLSILEGDCRLTATSLAGQIDRVLLGLIPFSEIAWEQAVFALKPTGGFMHVHANVGNTPTEIDAYSTKILEFMRARRPELDYDITFISKVKSYAARINHYVFDVKATAQ